MKSATRCAPSREMSPVVNMPLRFVACRAVSRFSPISSRSFAGVSSLCSTSPWAAWSTRASKAGSQARAASWTHSHWVAAGNGMPKRSSRRSKRWKGKPAPYFNTAILLAALSSYFLSPMPSGAWAVNTVPQRLQRSFSSS